MEKKKSRVLPTMAVISLIIIIFGILGAAALYSGISNEIAQGSNEALVIEGKNIAPFVGGAGKAGAAVLSAAVVIGSFLVVIAQWVIYGVIRLICGAVSNRAK